MTEKSVEPQTAARRSGLALLLTRTPFDLVLRGCTADHLRAAVPAASLPRQVRVKVREDELVLRKYGGPQPMNTGWAIKARMEETVDGVRLTGHQCYLADRIYAAWFAVMAMVVLGIAAWFAVTEGLGSPGLIGCLVVACIPGLLAVLVVATQPKAVARQDERSKQIIRGLLEAG